MAKLANAISDLHLADARFHRSFCAEFHSYNENLYFWGSKYNYRAFLETCLVIVNGRSRFFNSLATKVDYRSLDENYLKKTSR